MDASLIQYEAREQIGVITLNDPPANTYSYEMMQQLDRAILVARMDENVQVIVITGAGEKFFCAGANISMLSEVTPEFKYYFCLHANETLNRLEQTPKLVIAAINGHCVGGGFASCATWRGQDGIAGSFAGSATRHRRYSKAGASSRQVKGD